MDAVLHGLGPGKRVSIGAGDAKLTRTYDGSERVTEPRIQLAALQKIDE